MESNPESFIHQRTERKIFAKLFSRGIIKRLGAARFVNYRNNSSVEEAVGAEQTLMIQIDCLLLDIENRKESEMRFRLDQNG
jgi:hypothetical protein